MVSTSRQTDSKMSGNSKDQELCIASAMQRQQPTQRQLPSTPTDVPDESGETGTLEM